MNGEVMPPTPHRETVISNGQRAMHLQRVNLAVRVSDLAATSSAFFDVTAAGEPSEELNSLIPELRQFVELIGDLQDPPDEARRYRTLIPAEVWRQGTADFGNLSALDEDIDTALDAVEKDEADPGKLRALAERLSALSKAFSELGRGEYDRLMDPQTADA